MTKPVSMTASPSDDLFVVTSGSIIVRGKVNPIVVLALLGVWALGSTFLGIMFGMRPRWSESLDRLSMFRFGREVSNFRPDDNGGVIWYGQLETGRSIPGMVGHDSTTGQVTLVRKAYRGRDI
jgi:hypothetical protein